MNGDLQSMQDWKHGAANTIGRPPGCAGPETLPEPSRARALLHSACWVHNAMLELQGVLRECGIALKQAESNAVQAGPGDIPIVTVINGLPDMLCGDAEEIQRMACAIREAFL